MQISNHTKLKKDDQVIVIAGKDKGKVGKILKINTETSRVLVEGVNLVSKAIRKKTQQDRGGIIQKEAFIHISNVQIMDAKGKATRIGYREDAGQKIRVAVTTGDKL
jgi:large subunit ribosomal protein L24